MSAQVVLIKYPWDGKFPYRFVTKQIEKKNQLLNISRTFVPKYIWNKMEPPINLLFASFISMIIS